MIKYIGFDKDGTLFDSMPAITKEWGKIIQNDFGINAKTAERIFSIEYTGQPTDLQLKHTLKTANISLSKEELHLKASEIRTRLGKEVRAFLFPEVMDVLKELKSQGYGLFLSSSHGEDVVKNDLKRVGLIKVIDFFTGVRKNDPSFIKGKPHFKAAAKYFKVPFTEFVKESIFVGDTLPDVKAAKSSKMISIAREGTLSSQELLDAGADYVVKDISEIFQILENILPN